MNFVEIRSGATVRRVEPRRGIPLLSNCKAWFGDRTFPERGPAGLANVMLALCYAARRPSPQ
jgi:hypothetical protein